MPGYSSLASYVATHIQTNKHGLDVRKQQVPPLVIG
jgi:hypothetical protein